MREPERFPLTAWPQHAYSPPFLSRRLCGGFLACPTVQKKKSKPGDGPTIPDRPQSQCAFVFHPISSSGGQKPELPTPFVSSRQFAPPTRPPAPAYLADFLLYISMPFYAARSDSKNTDKFIPISYFPPKSLLSAPRKSLCSLLPNTNH